MKDPQRIQVLRLGSRASPLARAQSGLLARALERAHPALRVEPVEIATQGDRDRRSALHSFGGAGVFVKALEVALQAGRIDAAVHSLKDLPTRLPKGLILGAVGPREDVRDVLVTRRKSLSAGAVLGSGSPRRRGQMLRKRPGLRFEEIRGNVESRLRQVAQGRYDGTILARAGLRRLRIPQAGSRLARLAFRTLPLSTMLPAPGQGALAVECRAADGRTRRLLRAIHDPRVAVCVNAERALLAALGGGCHLPLGACARVSKGRLELTTVLVAPDGSSEVRARATGPAGAPEALGRRVAQTIRLRAGTFPALRRLLKGK